VAAWAALHFGFLNTTVNRLLPCRLPTGSQPGLAILGGQKTHMLGTVLIIIVVLLLIGALPTWPYSSAWGYYPSGGLGLILLVVLLLLLLGRI
jgi:hypothetical protein